MSIFVHQLTSWLRFVRPLRYATVVGNDFFQDNVYFVDVFLDVCLHMAIQCGLVLSKFLLHLCELKPCLIEIFVKLESDALLEAVLHLKHTVLN